MRIASFNVENLFERARALNQDQWVDEPGSNPSRWAAGRPLLDAYAGLNALLRKSAYGTADKAKVVDYLIDLGLGRSDESRFVRLRQNRGKLLKRPRGGGIEIVAEGRDDWIGWLELRNEAVDEVATQNTARVIRDVDADIVAVIEADHRISLCRFNEQVLPGVGGTPYAHIMLIDGNDDRGIDVGLLTRAGHPITTVRSHVDDRNQDGLIFSRDCPEYRVELASGETLIILVNHLKSKGYGVASDSNARRRAQAVRIREIYDGLRVSGEKHIAVVGDFNDTPRSAPLAPLLDDGSELLDISVHPKFENDGRPGTYASGTKSNKIDYILLSPALFDRVEHAGTFRKGVWGGKNGALWPIFPELEKATQAAFDHAALFVDLNL
ncbi:endonuclease/exonuclease/phosphatase [Sphingobium sp. SCG-1]|uniref:endonuclease/exonuclease/phosphatase family protein n=1 Tax=Sphingobium sp. SCG-1 TaxID=2072936 RepID=UPI000CD6C5C1|nr:endonuclease/exonuclease/phosphatase family protein [Sphingobium sp. SCG-1]AUW59745.1 endonuclease/exonuclease/phosphatase [Sphingobium sp. SCG-1]